MTSNTTTHLSHSRRDRWIASTRAWLADRDPIALGGLLVIAALFAGGAIRDRLGVAPAQAPREPIILIATPALPQFAPPTRAAPLPTAMPLPTAAPIEAAAPPPPAADDARVLTLAIDAAPTTAPDDALNDPDLNGNNLAPPGCPFPIINGVCGNGVLAKTVPDVAPRPSIGGRTLK